MPQTEEGLQQVLRQLGERRAAGDLIEVGNGLLALAFLVKWVRSDTAQPPFVRSHELALEALEVFRRAGDRKGQARALVAASPMAGPEARASMLSEAQSLAADVGDENDVAMTLAAQARALAMSDREGAAALHRRVLDIYRRTGNQRGQAQALFSLAITLRSLEEKRDLALEGARLFRAVGDPSEASRCVSLALMHAKKIEPLANLGGLAQEGLKDALDGGNRSLEHLFYEQLAHIAVAKGQIDEAEKYRRWAADLQDADGLTPRERWEYEVETTKEMIATAKAMGHKDAAKAFQEELKRLKAAKPRA